jgi:hypothetical protein
MAAYGPGCHLQYIIRTEEKLRSIYYFVGDRPVHKLPFGPKCHELFVILYKCTQYMQIRLGRHVFVIVYLRQKTNSDKIRKKTLYWSGPVNILKYWPTALTNTNRENKTVKYNITVYDMSIYIIRASARLLLNANSAIFQLYDGENKLNFNAGLYNSYLLPLALGY